MRKKWDGGGWMRGGREERETRRASLSCSLSLSLSLSLSHRNVLPGTSKATAMWVGGGVTSSRRMRVWKERVERRHEKAQGLKVGGAPPLSLPLFPFSLTFTKPTAMDVSSPVVELVRDAPDAAKA